MTSEKKTILVWNKNAYQNGFKLKLSDGVSSVLEAVNFRAASAASASALPLPPTCSYFTSSYPTHKFDTAQTQPRRKNDSVYVL